MIYTIIVKAKIGVPVQLETNTLDEAINQAGKAVLENFTQQNVTVELCPVAEWNIREESVQTTIDHLAQAVRDLLDLLVQAGNKIYDEPAVINALAFLQEAEISNTQISTIQGRQNERGATG